MANVGGQAVLEGVMMRGPGNWAVAVRTPNGTIAQVSKSIDSAMARHRLLRLPIVRGVMALGESLAIGFRALAISANYAAQEEKPEGEEQDEPDTELSRGALIFAFVIAIGFAVALFKVTPGLITELLPIKSGTWFVIVEGAIRVEVCSKCHPFYTGKQKLMDSAGRVERFQKKLERTAAANTAAAKGR